MGQEDSDGARSSGVHFSQRLLDELTGRDKQAGEGGPSSPELRPGAFPHNGEQHRTGDAAPPGLVPGLPAGLYPPAAPSLPPPDDARALQRRQEIASIRQVLLEIEGLRSGLRVDEETELRRATSLAHEMQAKQRRAPWRPIPCEEEKAGCISCYKERPQGTVLNCAEAVSRFLECTRRAQQDFVNTSVNTSVQ